MNGNTTVYNPFSTYGVRAYHIDTVLAKASQYDENKTLGSPMLAIYK